MIETLKPFTPEELPNESFNEATALSILGLAHALNIPLSKRGEVYTDIPFGPGGPMQTTEDLPGLENPLDIINSGSAQTGPHPNDIDGDPSTD